MDVVSMVQRIGAKFAAVVQRALDEPDFKCGDCERSPRCGLAPDEKCIFRAEQMERDEHRRALLSWRLGFLAGLPMTRHNDARWYD